MSKGIDLSKFRKSITKSIEGICEGFNDPGPEDWISTGNYALNRLISGDFNKGIPLGKFSIFSGSSGAGKSYICSGNLVREAQKKGIFCILLDSENALDESWLRGLGVDTSPDKLMKFGVTLISDVVQIINGFVKEYKEQPVSERQQVLIVIDSLGMLSSGVQSKQWADSVLKGDMGSKPKELMALVRGSINMIGNLGIAIVASNHSYASQDPYSPDDKMSGGAGPVYAASIVVAMKQLKLKEDDEGNKVTEVLGIRSGCRIMKTRFAKPFEDIELQIPYDTGLSPYSGLFDYLEKKKYITKDGNRYVYIDLAGTEHKLFRKEWNRNDTGIFDLVLSELDTKIANSKLLQVPEAELNDE